MIATSYRKSCVDDFGLSTVAWREAVLRISKPVRIHFIGFDRIEELDLVGAWEFVGLLSTRKLCSPPTLVTLNEMTMTGEHGMRFLADVHFTESEVPDVIFIPGGSGGRIAMEDEAVISFLQQRASQCKAILSVCTGSYLMKKAGLLAGRRATTHWAALDHLRGDPEVQVVEQRVVHDGKIWTSGGVSAGMDMMLEFIADSFGEAVAAEIQLEAEYFPSNKIYGQPFEGKDVSQYIRELC